MNRALVILVAAAWLAPGAAIAQDWKVYPYPQAGFAAQFPVPPVIEKSTFSTSVGVSLPMTRYVARQDHMVYRLDVVDYSSTNADPTRTIAETEKSFGDSGKVTVAIAARVNREFGRELSVNGADGSHSAVSIFFVNKHLYILDGEALPPNAITKSGDTIRFQESLQFIGDNGGFGGFGGFRGQDRGRFRGFNAQALSACKGKSVGAAVQLDTPAGSVPATCTLIARPNGPPGER